MAQWVKNLPAMQETLVQPLGLEVPLERKWLPTPVLFPGESHGQRNLAGFHLRGHKELETTELLTHTHIFFGSCLSGSLALSFNRHHFKKLMI